MLSVFTMANQLIADDALLERIFCVDISLLVLGTVKAVKNRPSPICVVPFNIGLRVPKL